MKAILPINFNLKNHLQQNPPQSYGIEQFNEDHALFLLSQITLAPAQDQQLFDQMNWQTNFVQLYSNRLQAYVHNYKKYLTYFINTDVVECDNRFILKMHRPGEEKSLGYRFVRPYDGSEVKTVDYGNNFTRVLKKRLQSYIGELKPDYDHLLKRLWPILQLTVDYKLAIELAVAKRDFLLKHPEKQETEFDKKTGLFKVKDPNVQYKYTKTNLLSLYTGHTHIHIDGSGKRLHTILTNMQKDYRNLLTYKGEYLISFDIKNSQPYFITSLFNERMYVKNPKGVNIYTINTNLLSLFPNDLGKSVGFFKAFENPDVVEYKSLVSDVDNNPSDLYLYMWKELEKQGIHYASRDEVKPVMYEVLFTANGYNPDLKKDFKQLFPTVDELLRKFKVIDKTLLPCLLQSIESHVVLKVIAKRMDRQYPAAPLFTIHDSLATTELYADRLKTIMEEELTKFTGLPPKLDNQIWHPDNIKLKLNEYKF